MLDKGGLECDFAAKQSRSQYWFTGGGGGEAKTEESGN